MKQEYIWPKDEKLVYLRPPVEEYHGALANFYSSDCFPELNILKEKWKEIREEILDYENKFGEIKGMSSKTPAKMEGGSWSLIYLKSFDRLFKKNRSKFPVTSKILDQIPNCVLSSISILPPNIEIAPHFGDTNGIVRVHLGVIVPEPYPTIGIKVNEEERGWEEGELLCFVNVQKHQVWNRSNKRRYVIMLDIVPSPLMDRRDEICVLGLGSQTFIFFYKNYKFFRLVFPKFIHSYLVCLFSFAWRIWLPIERKINS